MILSSFQTLETIDEKAEIVSEQILTKIEDELMARLEELDMNTTTETIYPEMKVEMVKEEKGTQPTYLTTILEEDEKKEESEMTDAQTDEKETDKPSTVYKSTGKEKRSDSNQTEGEKKEFDTEGNKDESGGATIGQVIDVNFIKDLMLVGQAGKGLFIHYLTPFWRNYDPLRNASSPMPWCNTFSNPLPLPLPVPTCVT